MSSSNLCFCNFKKNSLVNSKWL